MTFDEVKYFEYLEQLGVVEEIFNSGKCPAACIRASVGGAGAAACSGTCNGCSR